MIENATTLEFQPGKTYEALTLLRESIGPVLMQQPGLLSLGFVPDFPSNRITVLSAWSPNFSPTRVEACAAYRREIARLDRLLKEPGLNASQDPLQN